MKITMTQEDINETLACFRNGERRGPCPIERAFKRNGIDAVVGTSIMHINGDFKDKYGFKVHFKQMMTPKEFDNFPYEFDRNPKFRRNCKPFSFQFEMPE